jgi:hypothetical protein
MPTKPMNAISEATTRHAAAAAMINDRRRIRIPATHVQSTSAEVTFRCVDGQRVAAALQPADQATNTVLALVNSFRPSSESSRP